MCIRDRGFGISINVFKAVTSVLVHEIAEGDEDQLNDYAEACFKALDTDENDLIDALEFLATFALISAMNIDDKIKFMFDCYDFDESGMLTIDEMTLSLKSTITGLAKLAGVECPSEQRHFLSFSFAAEPMTHLLRFPRRAKFLAGLPSPLGPVLLF